MTERKYLPTIAELIDRLSIVLMKSIFIDSETYKKEIRLIEADIDTELGVKRKYKMPVTVDIIYYVLVLMLANRFIWENESRVRAGKFEREAVNSLIATHVVNGVRNRAKNQISLLFGERKDLKTDCLAEKVPIEYKNWNVFE